MWVRQFVQMNKEISKQEIEAQERAAANSKAVQMTHRWQMQDERPSRRRCALVGAAARRNSAVRALRGRTPARTHVATQLPRRQRFPP